MEVFSPHIADLLVRCCVQIEAIAKELYFDIGGEKKRGDTNLYFDEDCLKLIDKKWKMCNKIVIVVAPFFNLTKKENRVLTPLKNAYKRQGTYWERAYQAVKHDRYTSIQKGNVKAFINALAALFLLNIYYRRDSWVTTYQEISKIDYSMGSALFAVIPPDSDKIWYGNKAIPSTSTYVVTYREEDYQLIKSIQEQESEALNNYWNVQPELQEIDFKYQLTNAIEREKENPNKRGLYLSELAKYRLNKKIPRALSFDERKKLLVRSQEWNGRIRQQSKHLSVDELTEENIQEEIDRVGALWGTEICQKFEKTDWARLALIEGVCNIYIPEDSIKI